MKQRNASLKPSTSRSAGAWRWSDTLRARAAAGVGDWIGRRRPSARGEAERTSAESIVHSPLTMALVWVLVAVALGPGARAASDVKSDLAEIWKDPIFQRQFVGSYGIHSDVEPRLSIEEVKVLEKVRPLMADDLPKAEAALLKSIKPDGSATLDFTLAGIQFQLERFPEALANYQKAVTKFPSFRRAWRNLGLIHSKNGAFDEAIRAFTKMIELGGGDAYSYGLLGYAYGSKQDYQAAEAAYRTALLLQPDNTKWRLGLTECVFKQEKFQDAAALLDVLIERFPDKSEFWMLQAKTFLGMKRPLEAAKNIEALELLDRADAESLHTLGDIYAGEALYDLSARAYGRAIAKGPEQPFARALRAAEQLWSRGAHSHAKAVTAAIHATWKDSMAGTDRRKLLKLEARLDIAEGRGGADTATTL